mgnify:CR=1 FL=1
MRAAIRTAAALAALFVFGACSRETRGSAAAAAQSGPAPAVEGEVASDSDAAPAAAFRDDMPPNVWVRVKPRYEPPPDGGKHLPEGWNKLVYDPVGRRVVYMDRWKDEKRSKSIYANAVMAFDVGANVVTCVKLTNWKRQDVKGGGYRTVALPENEADPTPCDRHPYGNLTLVPDQNSVYLGAGANRTAIDGERKSHAVCGDTWRLDLAAGKWLRIDEAAAKPPGGLEDAMEYDRAAKVIVRICRGSATWLLDVEKGRWRDAGAKDNPGSGMGAAMCYDSKRGRVMVFGGAGKGGKAWNEPHPECYAYSVKDNAWTRLADAPVPVRAMGAAYDSKRDAVMIHVNRKDRPAFFGFYLPEKDEWVRLDLPEGLPAPVPNWHTLAYDEAHDVFVRAAGPWEDPQWWLFRPDLSRAVPAK